MGYNYNFPRTEEKLEEYYRFICKQSEYGRDGQDNTIKVALSLSTPKVLSGKL